MSRGQISAAVGAVLLAMGLSVGFGVTGAEAQVRSTAVMGLLDLQNSTLASLSSSGGLNSTFLGRGTEVRDYAAVNVWALVSQNSAPNGLQLQWSGLASDQGFSTLSSYTLSSYTAFAVTVPEQSRWFRLLYTNGVVSLTSIALTVIHRPLPAIDLVSFAPGTVTFGPSGSILTSTVGLNSVSTGFGNVVLSSAVDSGGFRPPSLTSMVTKAWGTRLDSISLIAGTTGMRIAGYAWDIGLESLVSSVGFYSTNPGSTKLFGALPLWSSEYAAQGGIAKPGLCGPARCWPLFLTSVGDDLSFAVTSTGNEGRVRVNLLWSYER